MGKSPLVVHLSGHVSVPWTQHCTGMQTHVCIDTVKATHSFPLLLSGLRNKRKHVNSHKRKNGGKRDESLLGAKSKRN